FIAGTSGAVFMVWGAHLSQSAYWNLSVSGNANGAKLISGSPWHIRTQNLTDNGGTSRSKNQGRSIQPSALLFQPTLSPIIYNAATNQPITAAQQVANVQVYDPSTVGLAPGETTAPTGTVTYYFYNTATPVLGTPTPVFTDPEPVGTHSINTAHLA